MKTIVKMIFGSHLYGTNTPDSDTDYKGVFLPTKEQTFLNKIPKSYREGPKNKTNGQKNTKEDTDLEIYSLHYFIKLALEGQTTALDMLHAPEDKILTNSPIWREITRNKTKFYTKNCQAFVGYARKQAAKYGIKGSRLSTTKTILQFLKTQNPKSRNKTTRNLEQLTKDRTHPHPKNPPTSQYTKW